MTSKLSKKDLEFILEPLKFTKLKFEEYQRYPFNEFKQERIKEVQEVLFKVKQILKEGEP